MKNRKAKIREIKKIRCLRLSDTVWNNFLMLKGREDKSWDLYLTEIIEIINRIKNL